MDWSSLSKGVFLVSVLGVVYDPQTKKILIGRRTNDPHISNLSWAFPGGRPEYGEILEEGLRREIRKKTGIEVRVNQLIFARVLAENKEIVLLYYACEKVGGVEKAGELFTEVKWVSPREIETYFSTSVHPVIKNYLSKLI